MSFKKARAGELGFEPKGGETMKTQRVTRIIRDAGFVAVGVCEDGAIRLICKGARAVTFPKTHALYTDALALVEIEDTEVFESAVMGWIYP